LGKEVAGFWYAIFSRLA
jgi:hypothetical protein